MSSFVSASSIPNKINNPQPISATFLPSIVTDASETRCITAFIVILRPDFFRLHKYLFDSFLRHLPESERNFYSATTKPHRCPVLLLLHSGVLQDRKSTRLN